MIHIPPEFLHCLDRYDAELTEAAVQCVERGQAPPREIYRVQNRRRIDWGRLPMWARPSDPELFDGCCHEG